MSYNVENIIRLIEIVDKLRSKDGCPWDREQTHKTLRENLIEEAYETIDAIDKEDDKELEEELGDVLLQVVLHSQIAREEDKFSVDDVARGIADKLVRRHPHVFGDVKVKDSAQVIDNWEKIKKKEKPERVSALSGISQAQPALMTAMKMSKKAVKAGFEWPTEESLWECFFSEIEEFKDSVRNGDFAHMQDEFGDILFSLVNVARWYKIDPELALVGANRKFKTRFQTMEDMSEKPLKEYSCDELEELWQSAKKRLKTAK